MRMNFKELAEQPLPIDERKSIHKQMMLDAAQELNAIELSLKYSPRRNNNGGHMDSNTCSTMDAQQQSAASTQLMAITGTTAAVFSTVDQVHRFLSDFVAYEMTYGDEHGAQSLLPAVQALSHIGAVTSPELRQLEAQAFDGVSEYVDFLRELNAPAHIIDGFDAVLNVLLATDQVRKQERTSRQLCSMASVQACYEHIANAQNLNSL